MDSQLFYLCMFLHYALVIKDNAGVTSGIKKHEFLLRIRLFWLHIAFHVFIYLFFGRGDGHESIAFSLIPKPKLDII